MATFKIHEIQPEELSRICQLLVVSGFVRKSCMGYSFTQDCGDGTTRTLRLIETRSGEYTDSWMASRINFSGDQVCNPEIIMTADLIQKLRSGKLAKKEAK